MTDMEPTLHMVIPGNAQHIGARSEQQDSFGFLAFDDTAFIKHAGYLSVVADGMGGLALGKDSSETAVQSFLSSYAAKNENETIASVMDRSLHTANRAVNRRAAEAGVEGEAGTTLVAVVIHDGKLYRIGAGDSRIYLFRQGKLHQITTDYNYGRILDRMVEKGDISKAEASAHPSRAALTSYLGKEDVDEYDHPSDPPTELLPGDKILLASDGLFGFLPEDDIARLMDADPQTSAEALVQATIERHAPYQDNVTVAILGYDLPPVQPLAETQTRNSTTVQIKSAKPQRKSAVKNRKWIKVALLALILAVAGFVGGRYLGEQPGLSNPPVSGEKPLTKTLTEKPSEKSVDNAGENNRSESLDPTGSKPGKSGNTSGSPQGAGNSGSR